MGWMLLFHVESLVLFVVELISNSRWSVHRRWAFNAESYLVCSNVLRTQRQVGDVLPMHQHSMLLIHDILERLVFLPLDIATGITKLLLVDDVVEG